MRAYLDFWKNYVNFSGKTGRKDYWIATLWDVVLIGLIYLLSLLGNGWAIASAVLLVLYLVASWIPTNAMSIRRLRDGGFHWAFYFIRYVPLVGGIASIILACQPSWGEPERYPEDPTKESFYS